jgi:hypothetical protein
MLKKFLPETPDKFLNTSADLPLARFGHINQLVNAINNLEESSGGGIVESIVEGDNISIDNTDPANPIISADIPEVTGFVRTISGDSIISVDDTDPENITLTATVTGFVSSITSNDNTILVDDSNPESPDLSVVGFVPLAGTAGNPITGDIEMNGTATIKRIGTSATNTLRVGNGNNILKTVQNTGTTASEFITTYSTVEGGKCLMQTTDNTNKVTLLAVKASTTNHSIEVDSDNSNFAGIQYINDFS